MTSIRQQVFDYINIYPNISRRELRKAFKECPSGTIDRYYTQHNKTSKPIQIDIRTELIKIILHYKTPASARVQAIREYNNMKVSDPIKGDDPLVELLKTLEKDSSDSQK